MKILHIYKCYYPFSIGGIEKHIHSLSESLHDCGVESAILTTQQNSPALTRQIGKSMVYYFPTTVNVASCPMSFSLLKNFRRVARDFDILHYHFPWPFADLTNLLTFCGKPVVVTYHSDIVRQKWLKLLYDPVMRLFLNQARAIIASSDHYFQSSPVLKQYSTKVMVIPFGLDNAQYPPPTAENLQRWQNQVGDHFFLFVGTLRYYKGLDFLLEAVRDTNIRIVIAGGGFEEARLRQFKETHKMNNVIFTGQITEQDKAALYHLCRASIAPAHLRAEAFCISLLESLIYGKPAISTELATGTSFVNQHQISGLVVPPGNSQAIRQAMQLLLDDESLYQRLQRGTQSHYTQHFTVESMREKHLKLYRQILAL